MNSFHVRLPQALRRCLIDIYSYMQYTQCPTPVAGPTRIRILKISSIKVYTIYAESDTIYAVSELKISCEVSLKTKRFLVLLPNYFSLRWLPLVNTLSFCEFSVETWVFSVQKQSPRRKLKTNLVLRRDPR